MWTVPAARMRREVRAKLHGAPHLVPLPKQAVSVLRELKTQSGSGLLAFRGERHHHRAMSENTINAALRAMGFPQDEVTGHGFRATARTMLQERLGFEAHVIEAQSRTLCAAVSAVPTTAPSSSSSAARCCRPGRTIWTVAVRRARLAISLRKP